jgi:1,4-alpha-glucan branching enzyme
MSLKKQILKSKPVCKVTFRFPKGLADDAETVALVGSFNNWDPAACQMTPVKAGGFTIQLDLGKDKSFEFRYVVDGKDWYNDPEADSYVPNGFGEENGIVITGE